MVSCRWTIVSVFLFLLSEFNVKADDCGTGPEIVCYYGSWAIYRQGEGQFSTDKINPQLCTNIIYSFAGLNLDLQIASLDPNADITLGGFANLTKLKEQYPCVRTTLALGGWNEGSLKYSVLASSEASRQTFADDVLKFLVYYGFDGLDFDWEYPTTRGGIDGDKVNFIALLKAIKGRISPWGLKLSIAASIEDSYYDIAGIADNVDYVHLMGYDITSSNSEVTGLLAPLSIINEKVDIWIQKGLPKSKLIFGIPAYGRCFNLANRNDHSIGAPVTDTTCGGVWTDEDGFLSFYEVQDSVKNGYCQGTQVDDDNVYSWCDDVWMTYDNEQTVTTKVRYAIDSGLGGVMIWSLDTDDFLGMYGNKYTLLQAIYDAVNSN